MIQQPEETQTSRDKLRVECGYAERYGSVPKRATSSEEQERMDKNPSIVERYRNIPTRAIMSDTRGI